MCSEEDSEVSHCGILKWFAIKQAIPLKCSSMHTIKHCVRRDSYLARYRRPIGPRHLEPFRHTEALKRGAPVKRRESFYAKIRETLGLSVNRAILAWL